ncbi:hypothetical protein [Bradyrhizobium tropiciagri]|uniref:hypothetical protein n=1 Tax=Bradyrhizobium tropiciagri TaxID=312253 RepID=UPI00067BF0B6|nr:hypothetical protein [Bradyrhizobium tropiciagri]
MASDVQIDRFVFDATGVSVEGARRIAVMVAEGLASADGLPEAFAAPRLKLVVSAPPDADEATLARMIVAAALHDFARTM